MYQNDLVQYQPLNRTVDSMTSKTGKRCIYGWREEKAPAYQKMSTVDRRMWKECQRRKMMIFHSSYKVQTIEESSIDNKSGGSDEEQAICFPLITQCF